MSIVYAPRLVRVGSAKALTQAAMPFGDLEPHDPTDRWNP